MQYHGRCCIWVDEYYLGDVSQDHHRSCIWADGVADIDSEEVLQDHHRSCICAEGVDEYNLEDRADEYKPEELRQRAQVGWQAKARVRDADTADWLVLVGHCGCGIVMGLLLFIVLMLFVVIIG